MRRRRGIAFVISSVALCAASICIFFQKPYSVASARVMVQSRAPAPDGVAQTIALNMEGGHRNLPVDWTVRLRSEASIRAALEHMGEDADAGTIEDIRKNLHARLVPGSTVIEVNLFGADRKWLVDFLASLLAVQDRLWNSPGRTQAESILQDLARRKAELQGRLARNSEELAEMESVLSLGAIEQLSKLGAASIQIDRRESESRAELSAVEQGAGNAQPLLLSGEQRWEVARVKAEVDEAEAQLAALESRYGPNHRAVAELKSRLEKLRHKQKEYAASEADRLKAVTRVFGSTRDDLQSKADEVRQSVMDDRRLRATSRYLIASANLDAAKSQLQWISQQQERIALTDDHATPSLAVLDAPAIRAGFQEKMKATQYSIAVIGAIFLWFACAMLADAAKASGAAKIAPRAL